MKIIAEGLLFPEGPVFLAKENSLVLCEIAGGRISKISQNSEVSVVAELGGGPNGCALGPDGRLYVCNNGGSKWVSDNGTLRPGGESAEAYEGGRIDVVDLENGSWETLYRNCGGRRLASPYDLVFDKTGGFYFTDYGKNAGDLHYRGGIYWAMADGTEIRQVVYPLSGMNGIALSPDGNTLYAAETASARVWAWEITEQSGQVKTRPFPAYHGATLVGQLPGPARFDSMAVSSSGKLLVATLIQGGIAEICPLTGTVRFHELPDRYVTNLCFGGSEMKTCFATLSFGGKAVELDWHEAGLSLVF